MSIETLLTLGVAAAILLLAAVLRFVILGSIRLALRITGTEVPWLQKPPRTGSGGPKRAPLAPRLARGGRSAAAGLAYTGSAFVDGLRITAAAVVHAASAVAAWASPRLRGASRSSRAAVAAAGRDLRPRVRQAARRSATSLTSLPARLKPAFVVTVATVQHLARLVAQRTRTWVQEHEAERKARPGEPTSAGEGPRVIDLQRDFDPLTDDFPEDRIGSPL